MTSINDDPVLTALNVYVEVFMQPGSTIEQDLKQQDTRRIISLQNFFFIGIGLALFLLGGFMVTDIHTWQVFAAWLPLSFLMAGIVLLSSKKYSVWLGALLLATSGLMWFHDYGLENFPNITHMIDWSLVVVGGLIVSLTVLRMSITAMTRSR